MPIRLLTFLHMIGFWQLRRLHRLGIGLFKQVTMNGSVRSIATVFSALTVAGILSACSNTLGVAPSEGSFFGPRVLSGNDRSVSVEILPVQNESDALATADKWCKKYSRSAVLVQDRRDGKFNYQCVE